MKFTDSRVSIRCMQYPWKIAELLKLIFITKYLLNYPNTKLVTNLLNFFLKY